MMLQVVSLDSYIAGRVCVGCPPDIYGYSPHFHAIHVRYPGGEVPSEYGSPWDKKMEYGALAWGLTLQFF
jgi:hypothetical protein